MHNSRKQYTIKKNNLLQVSRLDGGCDYMVSFYTSHTHTDTYIHTHTKYYYIFVHSRFAELLIFPLVLPLKLNYSDELIQKIAFSSVNLGVQIFYMKKKNQIM